MDRYKITFTTSSGDSDEREIECDSDAQAAEYAQSQRPWPTGSSLRE
jgi:hypothetical protein